MRVQATNDTEGLRGKTIEWIGYSETGTVWIRFPDGTQVELDPVKMTVADVSAVGVDVVNPSAWGCDAALDPD